MQSHGVRFSSTTRHPMVSNPRRGSHPERFRIGSDGSPQLSVENIKTRTDRQSGFSARIVRRPFVAWHPQTSDPRASGDFQSGQMPPVTSMTCPVI